LFPNEVTLSSPTISNVHFLNDLFDVPVIISSILVFLLILFFNKILISLCNFLCLLLNRSNYMLILCTLMYVLLLGALRGEHCSTRIKFVVFPLCCILILLIFATLFTCDLLVIGFRLRASAFMLPFPARYIFS